MAALSLDHPWAFAFGLLGNLISFMVYLAPIPTFRRVHKKKSTEGFQSEPYVVALFSAMLWIFYALVKTGEGLLITINSFGCVIETVYIAMFLFYAPKKVKIHAVKLVLALNVGLFSLIVLSTMLLPKGATRAQVLGWMCVGFAVSVFAAPLSIIVSNVTYILQLPSFIWTKFRRWLGGARAIHKQVVRTKSVEFMPFSLSFFLTLSAVAWFAYGLFVKDIIVTIPNVIGFVFGVVQMVLYIVYKDTKVAPKEDKLPEHVVSVSKIQESRDTPSADSGGGGAEEKREEGIELSPV